MPKRGAGNQLTKDNHEDEEGDEEVPTEQKLASGEKMAQRKIVKVKRKVTTGESDKPAGMPTFTFADDSAAKPAAAPAASASASASGSGAADPAFDASKPVVNSFAAFLPKSDEWECPDCFVRNKASLAKCRSCTAPNPSAPAAAGGKSADEQAVADAGISFGGGSSSGAAAADAPIFGATGVTSSFGADQPFQFGGDSGLSFGGVAAADASTNALDKPAETEATGPEEPNPAAEQFKGKKAEGTGEENDQIVHNAKCRVYVLKTVEKKDVKESALPKDDDDDSSSAAKPASNGASAGNGSASASASGSGSGKVETEQKYVEVGSGDLHVNRFTKADGTKGARMVLRAEKTQRLVVNAPIFEGMSFAIQQEKYVRFISLGLEANDANGQPKMQAHLLRFKSKSEAADVHAHISTLVAEQKRK